MTSDVPEAVPAFADGRPLPLRDRCAGEVLLVTGFPGFRAHALVRVLAEREPNAELWLVVPPAALESAERALPMLPVGRDRLRVISGEPCAIDLGLSGQTYAELCRRVDRWLSLYQTAETSASRELCFRANLGSAREIVEFAKVAESLSHVTFLSSSLVAAAGPGSGELAEAELAAGQAFQSAAAESLAVAESLLRRRLSEVPVSIVRTPQVLGGPGQTPSVARPSSLHRVLALIASAPGDAALPLPPGSQRFVQALPADFVAEALYAVSVFGTRGHTYHFCDPEPPTLAQLFERVARHLSKRVEHGLDARALGRLLLGGPGLWFSQLGARSLSEWTDGPELARRGGDRLLERAGLRAPSLLGALDAILRETEALSGVQRLDAPRPSTPFEAVA